MNLGTIVELHYRQRAIEALELLQHLLVGEEPLAPAALTSGQRRAVLARNAQQAITMRHKRRELLGAELATEPCWEILLTLYTNWAQGARISVTDLAYAAGIPTPTVVRWLAVLVQRKFVCRDADPSDGRRIWISLTRTAVTAIEQVLTLEAFGTHGNSRPAVRAA